MRTEPSLTLINRLYDAAFTTDLWDDALGEITEDLKGTIGLLFIEDNEKPNNSFLREEHMSPEIRKLYLDEFFLEKDLWHKLFYRHSNDRVGIIGEAYISDRELKRTEFYNEVLKPDKAGQLLCCSYEVSPKNIRVLSISRSLECKRFGNEELHYVEQLSPHLRRAFSLHQSSAELRKQRNRIEALWSLSDQAVILLNEKGKIDFANQKAEAILREGTGISSKNRFIKCQTRQDSNQLYKLIGQTAIGNIDEIGGTMNITKINGEQPLNVLVVPVNPDTSLTTKSSYGKTIALFIFDPDSKAVLNKYVLRKLYSLTDAEIHVSQLIYTGLTPTESAKELGIKLSTVRTHLHRIFDKTETSNQAQLIRLFATGLASVNSNLES